MKIQKQHEGKRATITNGKSTLTGTIGHVNTHPVYGKTFGFRPDGASLDNVFAISDWDAKVNPLPTEPGVYAVDLGEGTPYSSRIFKLDRVGIWMELTHTGHPIIPVDELGRMVERGQWKLVRLVLDRR